MDERTARRRALKIIIFLIKKALRDGDFENCIDDDTEIDEVELIKEKGEKFILALERRVNG
jgi:hypothetical protein